MTYVGPCSSQAHGITILMCKLTLVATVLSRFPLERGHPSWVAPASAITSTRVLKDLGFLITVLQVNTRYTTAQMRDLFHRLMCSRAGYVSVPEPREYLAKTVAGTCLAVFSSRPMLSTSRKAASCSSVVAILLTAVTLQPLQIALRSGWLCAGANNFATLEAGCLCC